MVLDAYEKLIRENLRADHRYQIEHVGLITEKQLKRATELGVTITIFTEHIIYYYMGQHSITTSLGQSNPIVLPQLHLPTTISVASADAIGHSTKTLPTFQ